MMKLYQIPSLTERPLIFWECGSPWAGSMVFGKGEASTGAELEKRPFFQKKRRALTVSVSTC